MPPNPESSRLSRSLPRLLLAGGAALAVMAVALAFFCPRFYLWQTLGTTQGGAYPEVSRAQVVLAQLRNPYVIVLGETHQVVQWRLLFPALGHLLRLPPKAFLALPGIGAWLCLAWAFAHARSRMGSVPAAAWATLLVATLSWFFVSTGWLSYNDSWLVLALCLYAFSASQAVRIVVCLAILWVDERFIFQVPLLIALRHAHLGRALSQWRVTAREAAFELLALAPYVLTRLYLLASGIDASGREHFARHLSGRDPAQILRGLWEGLRMGWVALLLGAVAIRRRVGLLAALVGLAAVALAANNLVAHDVSRTASVLAPLVLAACLALVEAYGARGVRMVAGLALCNLLLPASDVIENAGGGPVSPVWREWPESRRMAQALSDASEGHKAYEAHDYARASDLLARAVAAEASFNDARRGLGWSLFFQGQFASALAHAAILTAGSTAAADDWLLRGLCEAKLGRVDEARRSLTMALKTGKSGDVHMRDVAAAVLSHLPPGRTGPAANP